MKCRNVLIFKCCHASNDNGLGDMKKNHKNFGMWWWKVGDCGRLNLNRDDRGDQSTCLSVNISTILMQKAG